MNDEPYKEGLSKISMDGKNIVLQPGEESLTEKDFAHGCTITGPWIFYKSPMVPYMMKEDGSQTIIIPGYEKVSDEVMLGP